MLVPEAVARELERRPGKAPWGAPASGAPARDFVERRRPSASHVRRVEEGPPAIDPGEREVVALALGTGATAAMDDRRGVRRASRLGVPMGVPMGVPTVGTLAVLIELHRLGLAFREPASELDALGEAGMYLTEDLRRRVLEELREEGDPA